MILRLVGGGMLKLERQADVGQGAVACAVLEFEREGQVVREEPAESQQAAIGETGRELIALRTLETHAEQRARMDLEGLREVQAVGRARQQGDGAPFGICLAREDEGRSVRQR